MLFFECGRMAYKLVINIYIYISLETVDNLNIPKRVSETITVKNTVLLPNKLKILLSLTDTKLTWSIN